MIKRILVPLDTSPYTETALDVSCAIARQHDAQLTGLVILDIPGIEKSVGPAPMGAYHYAEELEEFKKQKATERIEELLAKFAEKCQHEGISHTQAQLQGSPSERILGESIYYDAVVVGLRTFFDFESSDGPGIPLDELLDHTVTPIYGVPRSFALPAQGEKLTVLIAFDGSLPAAKALQRFAYLELAEFAEVLLLTSAPHEDEAQYYLGQAQTYLNAHGISDVRQEWTQKGIIQAVEEEYLDWASFFVIGAHSKKGLLDFFLGSLTRYLIQADSKPVLIG